MSFSKRIFAFVLALVMLVPALLTAVPVGASTGTGGNSVTDNQTYTKKKVVSVVYDTSYSMSYASAKDNRSQYAKYASQTLMSLLDDADKLVFFPLSASNGSSNVSVSVDNYRESWARVDVDLDHPSGRSEAIRQALSSDKVFGRTTGSTPAYAIQAAVQELIDAGMKTNEEMTINATSDTEYYLVILADGEFDSTTVEIDGVKKALKDDQIVNHFAEPSKYFSYQCIYLGFGAAKDYSATPFNTQNGNVTTMTATSVPDLTAKMQQIANQITGRYSTPYTCAQENGQTVVTVDINSLSFGLRTISVLMQNSNASLVSAKYGSETLSVSKQAKFSGVTLQNEDALKGGFSTVLHRTNTKTDFSGGELKLTFTNFTEADKQNLSILLEPSLEIKPYVLHGGKEVDAVYVNSYLKPGDKIQMGFTIHKSGDPDAVIPVGNLSGETTAKFTYNGTVYGEGQDIPLLLGDRTIAVEVSIMDGDYTLYSAIQISLFANGNAFRIEPNAEKTAAINAQKGGSNEVLFTVYYNNQRVTGIENLRRFTVEDFGLVDKQGNAVPDAACSYVLTDDGILCSVNVDGLAYGVYKLKLSVYEGRYPRFGEAQIVFYPQGITVQPVGPTEHSMTLHGLSQNAGAEVPKFFTFKLTSSNGDFSFEEDPSVLRYTVSFNGVDVTAQGGTAYTVNGSTITVLPTPEALGALGQEAGNVTVSVSVTSPVATHINSTASVTLTLTDTVWEVRPMAKTDVTVDRFSLRKNKDLLCFAVYRDGEALNEEELRAAVADGTLSIDVPSFGGNWFTRWVIPVSGELDYGTVDGVPVVTMLVTSDQVLIREIFSALFMTGGEKSVSVTYASADGGAVGNDVYTVSPLNILIFILLILLLAVLLFLTGRGLILFTGFLLYLFSTIRGNGSNAMTTRFARGTFVKVSIELNGATSGKIVSISSVQHVGGWRGFIGNLMPTRTFNLKYTEKEMLVDNEYRVTASNISMELPSGARREFVLARNQQTESYMAELKSRVREACSMGIPSVTKPQETVINWTVEDLDFKVMHETILSEDRFLIKGSSTEQGDRVTGYCYIPLF